MQGFHIPAAPPLYTNTFLLISDAGHAVVIDPAAEVHSYDEILKQHNATLTTIPVSYTHLRREDDHSPFKGLCGAGVAFKLCAALDGCPPQ